MKTEMVSLAIILLLITACSPQPSTEKTRVGVSLPLTGVVADYGERYMNGAELAMEDHGQNIELVVEDDKCSAKEGSMVANKFINVQDLKIQMVMCGAVAPVFASQIEDNNTLLFVNSIRTEKFEGKHPFLFNMFPDVDREMKALAQKMKEEGINKTGVIYQQDSFGVTYKNKFIKHYENLGGKVEIVEGFDTNEGKDFKTTLEKMRSEGVQGIVNFMAHPQNYAILLQEAEQLRMDTDFFSQYITENQDLLKTAGKLANGITYSYTYKEPDTELFDDFKKEYRERYGEEPGPYAVRGYETIWLISQLSEECDQNVQCMIRSLQEDTHKGLIGEIRFQENSLLGEIHVKEVVNGEFVNRPSE